MSAKALFSSVCFYCAIIGVIGHSLVMANAFPKLWMPFVQAILAAALLTASWSRGVKFAIAPESSFASAIASNPEAARRSFPPPPPSGKASG